MSLYGALLSGVSGLRAQSQSLGTISDNISNVNTIGYKRSVAQFSTLVTGASSTSTYFPGGVRASPRALIDQQGVLQTSTRATDAAILGNGFFVVKSADNASGEQLYTRSGSFAEDNQGRLVNSAGYFLQGWALDQQGEIIDVNSIQTVSVSTVNGIAVDTTAVDVIANLNSDQAEDATITAAAFLASNPNAAAGVDSLAERMVAGAAHAGPPAGFNAHFSRDIAVFDALGTKHNLTLSFHRLSPSANNQWAFTIHGPTGEVDAAAANVAAGLQAFGVVTFDGDGNLGSVDWRDAATPGANDPARSLDVNWLNGANNSVIDFNFGTPGATDGLRQFTGDSTFDVVNQNGAEVGLRTGVVIDPEGYVIANFSNGATQKIYKLPVATFADPARLEARNGNAYAQTDASGEFNLREANTGGAGRIEPGALEGSNVDLSEEFTAMIVTQRAYSASAKTITTADDMLNELLNIKR
jgi:flagellar hook protein FlgE